MTVKNPDISVVDSEYLLWVGGRPFMALREGKIVNLVPKIIASGAPN